jgi:hypothetical protein
MTRPAGRLAWLMALAMAIAMAMTLAFNGCSSDETTADSDSRSKANAMAIAVDRAKSPEERQAFFGDLHIHSSWSLDAYDAGVRVGPEQAYRYARGESIPHIGGQKIQLAGPPLDFMALTDHAEYLGIIQATSALRHPLHALPLMQDWFRLNGDASVEAWIKIKDSFAKRQALPALATDAVVMPAWRELIDLANQYDQPGVFTAFVGYEYSSNPDSQNLHRNVLFRGANVPARPFSAMDSQNPEDLWKWMDAVRSQGGDDLLAIPHNSNGSNGLMFARTRMDGSPIDLPWAEQRVRNEPIVEVMQIKGQSETLPILSPDDDWAAFEMAPWRTLNPTLVSRPEGSYVRDALKTGLLLRDQIGANPYQLGMIGSTDGHNASSPFEEANYTGKIGTGDATADSRLAWEVSNDPSIEARPSISIHWSAAGLAGIWADANTRADLFDALRRREAYSTSGPRIRVRLFAGWDFSAEDLTSEISQIGYDRGVPMGGTLPVRPIDSESTNGPAPTFLIAALKDPLEAELERVQIVKGWTENGVAHEQVFDVGCADGAQPDSESDRCPHRAREPDLASCLPDSANGARELRAWWVDPTFEPAQRAFYYVRVLQIPTCRWSTWDAIRLGVKPHPFVPATIQERAITSPVWYDPAPRTQPLIERKQ